ncbi:MAG: hypothetical protein ACRC8Y_13000 [Chroococcales cyanobacterium]
MFSLKIWRRLSPQCCPYCNHHNKDGFARADRRSEWNVNRRSPINSPIYKTWGVSVLTVVTAKRGIETPGSKGRTPTALLLGNCRTYAVFNIDR